MSTPNNVGIWVHNDQSEPIRHTVDGILAILNSLAEEKTKRHALKALVQAAPRGHIEGLTMNLDSIAMGVPVPRDPTAPPPPDPDPELEPASDDEDDGA